MIEKIEKYLYEAQQMTKHEPVVNLKVTVDIGEGLLVMLECGRDKNVTLELKTDNMEIRVFQKGHFSKHKPRESRHVNIGPIRNHSSPKKKTKNLV